MAEAFENCALGMISLMMDPSRVEPRRRVRISARGGDDMSLLAAWLSEILFLVEVEGWAFASFALLEVGEGRVEGWGEGEPLDAGRHALELEIKAPTYHMMELGESEGEWRAQVIFDV